MKKKRERKNMSHEELAKVLSALEPLQQTKKRRMEDVLAQLSRRDAPLVAAGYTFTLHTSRPSGGFSRKRLTEAIEEWNASGQSSIPIPDFVDFAATKNKKEPKPRLRIRKNT
jgi:hypothetical protein